MIEEFRDIEGYEGLYQVSNLGRVKSLERYIERRNASGYYGKEKVLRGRATGEYLSVSLYCNFIKSSITIHKLVATTFLGESKGVLQVNHKNGIKTDNRVENLEWCTPSQNIVHAYATGLLIAGEGRYNSKLTSMEATYIKYNCPEITDKDLAKKFNISRSAIYNIRSNRKWKHI